MLTCGSTGRSRWVAPGMPASCSRKKHTALPRSAHDPPPKLTTRVDRVAAGLQHGLLHERHRHVRLDLGEGGLEVAAEQRARTRSPSGDASRPAVVTSIALRAPMALSTAGSWSRDPAPNTSCCA